MQSRQLPALPPCLFLLAACSLSSPRAAPAGCWKSKKHPHPQIKITPGVKGTMRVFHVGSGAPIPWMLESLSDRQGRQLPTQPYESQFRVRGQHFLFLKHQPHLSSGSGELARLTRRTKLGFKSRSQASVDAASVYQMQRFFADQRAGGI